MARAGLVFRFLKPCVVAAFLAVVAACGGGGGGGEPVRTVTTVTLSGPTTSPKPGGTAQLTAVAKDQFGDVVTSTTATWSTSDPTVAVVSANGLLQALAGGTVTVTATINNVSGTLLLNITSPVVTKVTVTSPTLQLQVGSTVQLTAAARDQFDDIVTGVTTTWSTSPPSIATVSATGLLQALAPGTVTATATIDGVPGLVSLTVTSRAVASVTVTSPNPSPQVGQSVQLVAVARDANGEVIATATPTWSTSSASIATVSATGVLQGQSAGAVVVIAMITGVSGSLPLTITQPAIASHCLEVVPDHNTNDPSRINVVFLFGGSDSATSPQNMPQMFRGLISGTDETGYSSLGPELAKLYAVDGLVAIEPFASNFDRFNFWYVDLPLYGATDVCSFVDLPPATTCSGNVLNTTNKDGSTTTQTLTPQNLASMGPAGIACDVPHRYNVVLWSETAAMTAGGGHYAIFGSYAQVQLLFGPTTDIAHVWQGFVHEFVHAIGWVLDEKGNFLSAADFPGVLSGPNCWSLGPSRPLTTTSCAADENRPWHDLVGNGCGEDGVVDCPKTASQFDPNTGQWWATRFDEWIYEVRDDVDGCGQGCAYWQGNVFRPYQGCNVMSMCGLVAPFSGPVARLGPVNEREVCRKIRSITGAAGGACDLLCLDGCAAGQRCIKGTCKPKP